MAGLAEAIAAGDRLAVARAYVAAGLSVIPVRADGSKAPALSKWEPYQERKPTADELAQWFAHGRAVGVAIVCGAVSGNLAVMDFEQLSAWERWLERAAAEGKAGLVAAYPIVRTPKGGRHLYCRIREGWAPGGRLAMRSKRETLIEIRGQGNYVLAPGCPSACHELNVPYTFESEGWLSHAAL